MSTIHRWVRGAVAAATLACSALHAIAAEPADEASIRQVILSTWDKPDARVEVGPVVVVGNHAVAGWTQGQRGGRALMARNAAGHWAVAACGGDGLKSAKTLESTGMAPAQARQLSASVAKAEADVAPARRALFSTFDGLLRMNEGDAHTGHAASGAKP